MTGLAKLRIMRMQTPKCLPKQ